MQSESRRSGGNVARGASRCVHSLTLVAAAPKLPPNRTNRVKIGKAPPAIVGTLREYDHRNISKTTSGAELVSRRLLLLLVYFLLLAALLLVATETYKEARDNGISGFQERRENVSANS